MPWRVSHRADADALPIANRHYNRQKPDSPQFVPPGSCLVLLCESALWVTSWPRPEFVRHRWAGAWVNSLFRREGGKHRASDLIRWAVAATRHWYGEPPGIGMVTFIDREKVRPTIVRGKQVWGWTYRKAGFVDAGVPDGGLLALQLWPDAMPRPEEPATKNGQLSLW